MPIYNSLTGLEIKQRKRKYPPKLRGVITNGQPYEKSCLERISDLRDMELIASHLEAFQKECHDKGIGTVDEFITEILANFEKKQKEIFKAIII